MAGVLIIDDDELICDALVGIVTRMGHEATRALTLSEGINAVSSEGFDAVFLDVRLPDGNGLTALPEIRKNPSQPEVIIITGQGDPDGAELAIKNGAWDYLEKPASIDQMRLPLVRALEYRKEKGQNPRVALRREKIVGNSRPLERCLDLVAQAAHSKANVLISGETGTGKELFAWAIHNNSPNRKENFVIVDCASIPETLVESALFGHKKGAFTGADKDQDGLITQADKGTLFLDEVGELPMTLQRAFLRVLQEHRFRPLGERREVKSDFRLLSATNRNLNEMVQQGRFRKDLLFRLRAITIDLPPLRERVEDIEDLVVYHTAKLCTAYGLGLKGISPDVLEVLRTYDWPGNVRELVNVLDRAIAAANFENTLYIKHLPDQIRISAARALFCREAGPNEDNHKIGDFFSCPLPTLGEYREALLAKGEKEYLEKLMSHTKGEMAEACQISGLGRARLYGIMKKRNVTRKNGV